MTTVQDILASLDALKTTLTAPVVPAGDVVVAQSDLDKIAADVAALTALVTLPSVATTVTATAATGGVPFVPTLGTSGTVAGTTSP